MKIWTDGTLYVFDPDSLEPGEPEYDRVMHAARNSYESYQILLKNEQEFTITGVRFDGFEGIEGISFRYNFQETISFAKADFQDPLSNETTRKAGANQIQSVWVTAHIGKNMHQGSYEGRAVILTNMGEYPSGLKIRVYSAVLPDNHEAAFATEYWMNTVNFWFRYPNVNQMDFLNYYYGCEKYSDTWWEINKAIAVNMKENRINVLFVRTHDLLLDSGTAPDEAGKYHFHWDLFDKWISFFDRYADIKWFAGYHLVVQAVGKDVYMIDNVDGRPQIITSPIGSEKTENWLKQFLTALNAHLEETGYKDRWMQHIEDEASDSPSWLYAAKWVKEYLPGVRCLDAIDTQKAMPPLQGHMDVWIPRVDIYEKNRDFYDYRLAQGDSRWVYNCCVPGYQNYANKFLGWPIIHNRVLPWGCFVNHFSGFLHWGYNFWDPQDTWFGLTPTTHFKGDGYIVYPDAPAGRIRNSIRMIATRDGAQDFELLTLLAVKDAEKAFRLARKVISRFNDFNWETENMEEVRIELLEAIEAYQ